MNNVEFGLWFSFPQEIVTPCQNTKAMRTILAIKYILPHHYYILDNDYYDFLSSWMLIGLCWCPVCIKRSAMFIWNPCWMCCRSLTNSCSRYAYFFPARSNKIFISWCLIRMTVSRSISIGVLYMCLWWYYFSPNNQATFIKTRLCIEIVIENKEDQSMMYNVISWLDVSQSSYRYHIHLLLLVSH